MTAVDFLNRLECVRSRGPGKWSARCPGHADASPSLSIREIDNKIVIFCFSGCRPQEIVAAMGLTMADLFTDSPASSTRQATCKRQRIHLNAVAFRFELGALDRRLRAERVLTAAANLNIDGLTEQRLDRVMDSIAAAYADQERAEFLETVADDLRMKAYQERTARHAA